MEATLKLTWFIPECVGKTSGHRYPAAYPQVHPRVRGKTALLEWQFRLFRFIPECVGKTLYMAILLIRCDHYSFATNIQLGQLRPITPAPGTCHARSPRSLPR